jgi:putative CocE/NonD family hydrolase
MNEIFYRMRPLRLAVVAAGVVAVFALAGAAREEAKPDLRLRYAKYEHRIAMRDGATLFTSVYVPRDAGRGRRYPILLTRTPYGVAPYGEEVYPRELGPSAAAEKEGFIFAYQDVRGRFLSEGEFVDVRPYRPAKGPRDVDESSDAFDTIAWLVKHVPWNNGRVGVWGISYPGFYAAMAAIDAHPALVAVSPQAPIADWFVGDDFHHNGAFFLPHAFNFYASFGQPRPEPTTAAPSLFDQHTGDGYRFFLEAGPMPNFDRVYLKGRVAFWKEVMAHETYDGFWQARNTRPHLKAIRPSVLTVGGWFDAEDLFGSLETYKAIERQSPGGSNRLVMGPWSHGGWSRAPGESLGEVRFGQRSSSFFEEHVELPFFRHQLKGGADPRLPEAWVFETGRNEWRALDAWPPREAKPVAFYLAANSRLSRDAPAATTDAFDEYVSDPARPVPYVEEINIGMAREYMVADQRFAARRPDVLVYETEPLASELTVAGPVAVSLSVSTTGTDSDFIVKLIDVYPDDLPMAADEKPQPGYGIVQHSRMGGYQQLVRGEPFRGKFRRSFEAPLPFVPGEVDTVAFTMPDVFHAFRRGHRLMVQVQSSWFPLVNRNPQTFVDVNQAPASEYRRASERVWRTAAHPSLLRLPLLPR